MNTKICSKCKIEKEVSEFYKRKVSTDGLNPKCKTCCYTKSNKIKKTREDKKNDCKKYYQEHKEELKIASKNRYKNNKDKISKKAKEKRDSRTLEERLLVADKMKKYYEDNNHELKEKMKINSSNHYKKNKERLDKEHRLYEKMNKDKVAKRRKVKYHENKKLGKGIINTEEYKYKSKEYGKLYRVKNSEKIKINKKEYSKKYKYKIRERYKTDINFKLKERLRCRLREAIVGKYKSGSAVRDLGCSIDFFVKYIESLWQEGMSWDNWKVDGWHLDHRIALARFNLEDREELLKACHYKNIRPMWAFDNLSKSDRILPEDIEYAKSLGVAV